MSVVADLVAKLIAAGTAPEIAAAVVAEAFAAGAASVLSGGSPVDTTAEKRRAYDRERKAREREEKRKSGGSPVEIRGTSESAIFINTSPKNSESREGKKRNSRGEKIPPDWTPKKNHYDEGAKRGFSRETIDGFATDMRLWAQANEHRQVARKSNWDLTFSAWIRRQGFAAGQGPPDPIKPRTIREQAQVNWHATLDKLGEFARSEPAESGGLGGAATLSLFSPPGPKP